MNPFYHYSITCDLANIVRNLNNGTCDLFNIVRNLTDFAVRVKENINGLITNDERSELNFGYLLEIVKKTSALIKKCNELEDRISDLENQISGLKDEH